MIIVTGGAGFIGSVLVAALERKGVGDIVVCDWLGSADKWKNISKRALRDVVKPENLFEYLDQHKGEIEAIFHMGAISSTTEKDADLIIETNFTLPRNLWKWCGVHDVRFIYASSAATYGGGEYGFKDDERPEGLEQLRPLNPYGWSKHVFDRRVSRLIYESDNVVREPIPPQWVGLKFFNVYGPNEYHKGDQMSVVCKLFEPVMAGAAAKLFKSDHPEYGDGGQLRDFVYVKDCVDVMLWMYDHKDVSGIFNVGTGKARSFKDLAVSVFKAANKPEKINYIDMPQQLKGKYQYFTEADMTKLREVGYDKPFTELEDGIRDYVQNYLSSKDQYE